MWLAVLCAVPGIVAGLSYFVWPTSGGGIPWGLAGPLNFVVSAVIVLAFAAGVAFALFHTLTPVPLLRFDAADIDYRPVPMRGWFVPWSDVANVGLIKSRFRYRFRAITTLTLFVHPKAGPAMRRYGTRLLRAELSQRSIVSRSRELAEQIRRFHPIEYADYTGNVPDD